MTGNVGFPECSIIKHTNSLSKLVNMYTAIIWMRSANRLHTHPFNIIFAKLIAQNYF